MSLSLEQAKEIERYLREMEITDGELKAGKIGSGEAIRRLKAISEKLSG
jgi:hypothetical protein